jgi:tetratricopeptide (TPR) repeat protein/TolB-like protein
MKYFIILFMSIFLILNCESGANRKIKLASFSSNKTGSKLTSSSVIRVLPQDQSSVAIMSFRNHTGDPALQWLERGLADMFVTELSQSPYLNIINTKNLIELAEQSDLTEQDMIEPAVALDMARKADSDLLLSGKFYQYNDSMYIEVELRDTHSQKFIRKEIVNGRGMEQLFAMVDNLSEKVRTNIRGDLEEIHSDPINLVEMTTSVEAFRCYSSALENREKFFHGKSEECIEMAVQADTNFAAGYLLMAEIKLNLGKKEQAEQAIAEARKRVDKLSKSQKYQLELLEIRIDYDLEKHIAKLKQAIEEFPTNVDFHLELGRIYREIGKFDDALEQFEIVKELRPNKKTIYNDLGYIYAYRRDYKTGLEYIDIYKKMAPDEPNPFDSAGEILMLAGRLEEAIPQLKIALSINPTFYHSAEKLGRVYTELGDYKEALKYLDMAAKYAETEKMAQVIQWRRVMIYWKTNQIDEAIKMVDAIADESSKWQKSPNINAVLTKAFIYESIGETEKVKNVYETCFNSIKENEDSLKTYADFDRLVAVMLLSDLDPRQFLNFIEKNRVNVEDEKTNTLLNLVSVTLALRVKDFESAKTYASKNEKDQIKLITTRPHETWSDVWKYIFEVITADNSPVNADDYSKEILKIAEKENREDLILIGKIISALHYQKNNKIDKMEEAFAKLGIPLEEKWQISGPYHVINAFAYDYQFKPETDDLKKSNWQFIHDGMNDGYIDLKNSLSDSYWATAYALTYVYSPEERPVEIRIGSDESCKLWLNDNIILKEYSESGFPFDGASVKVVLHPGYNKLMIKVVNQVHEWGFLCRITDDEGNGFEDVKFFYPQEIDQTLASK